MTWKFENYFPWQTTSVSCTWFTEVIGEDDLDLATILKIDEPCISPVITEYISETCSYPNQHLQCMFQIGTGQNHCFGSNQYMWYLPAWLKFLMKTQDQAVPQRKQKSLGKVSNCCSSLLKKYRCQSKPFICLSAKFDKPPVQTYWFEPG